MVVPRIVPPLPQELWPGAERSSLRLARKHRVSIARKRPHRLRYQYFAALAWILSEL